ncbi:MULTISPECIES: hypothetical protein [Hyphomicrobiales]|uniref:hypothetical protein n=1 Tax=Hyphomicrobiales TaxID=356 RepID=UPI001E44B007|nr:MULTISPECIES: hypothetical protein [Hyphomicrobiales]
MSGAPFAYKTTNISVLGLFARDGRLEDILAADDPDRLVVDLDRIDDRMDIAFAGVGVARIELRVHQPGECVDLLSIDGGCHAALGAGMIERRLGPVPLSFQSGGALSQNIIELNDAVFNRAVKPLHAIFAVGQFLLQTQQAAVRGLALCRLTLDQ